MENNNSNYINSISRAISILSLYAKSADAYLGITQISRALGLHKTVVFRIVKTLEKEGWLVQDPNSNLYKLGINILGVASAVKSDYNHRDIFLDEINKLVKEFNEDVYLTAFSNMECLYIEKVDSTNTLAIKEKVGQTSPLHVAASAKVVLAYQEESVINEYINKPLKKYTEISITDKNKLIENLKSIREKGFEITYGELESGICGISVPIFNADGSFLYALSSGGPINRLEEKGIEHIKNQLLQASANITKKLSLIERYHSTRG